MSEELGFSAMAEKPGVGGGSRDRIVQVVIDRASVPGERVQRRLWSGVQIGHACERRAP